MGSSRRAVLLGVASLLVILPAVLWACAPPGIGINSPGEGATLAGTTKIDISVTSETEVKGVDIDGSTFVISEFNSTAGTFQISKSDSSTGYNGEIAGRELFFEVTIIDVTSA